MSSPPKASEKLHHFFTGLDETLRYFKRSMAPKIKEVHQLSGGFVRLREVGDTGNNNSQLFTRLSNTPPAIGDRVLVGYLEDGEAVILGRLHASGESDGLIIKSATIPVVTSEPTWSIDIGTGLTAVADGTNLDEVNIDFDLAFGDARYVLDGPPYAAYGGSQAANRYVSMLNAHAIGTLTGQTLTALRAYYVPVYCPQDCTVDAILYQITTAVTGNVRCAIFDVTSGFLPGARLRETATVSQSTTGVKTQALTVNTNLMGGRWYFLALISATAHAIAGQSGAGLIPALRGGSLGNMGESSIIIAQQDMGSVSFPDPGAAGSGPANLYLHLAARTV